MKQISQRNRMYNSYLFEKLVNEVNPEPINKLNEN